MLQLTEAEKKELLEGLTLADLDQLTKEKHEAKFEENRQIRAEAQEQYDEICAKAKSERDEIFKLHPIKGKTNRSVIRNSTAPTDSVVGKNTEIPMVISHIIDVCHEVDKGQSYLDAFKTIASKRGLTKNTICDACTRRLGKIHIDEFRGLLENKSRLIEHISFCFPDYTDYIRDELR